jgi:hypothetical protein
MKINKQKRVTLLLPVLLLTANISLANNELAPKIQIESQVPVNSYTVPGFFA